MGGRAEMTEGDGLRWWREEHNQDWRDGYGEGVEYALRTIKAVQMTTLDERGKFQKLIELLTRRCKNP
jgi:hypothetical protein